MNNRPHTWNVVPYRVIGYAIDRPYRVDVGGETLLNKMGEPRRFWNLESAIKAGQKFREDQMMEMLPA